MRKNCNSSINLFCFLKQRNNVENKVTCILKLIYFNHSENETKRNRHLYWASPYGLETTEVIANVVLFNFHNIYQVIFLYEKLNSIEFSLLDKSYYVET